MHMKTKFKIDDTCYFLAVYRMNHLLMILLLFVVTHLAMNTSYSFSTATISAMCLSLMIKESLLLKKKAPIVCGDLRNANM